MAKKILVDNRYASVADRAWGSKYEILPSATHPYLQEPVSAHPDMVFVQVGEKIIVEKTVFEYYKKLLPDAMLVCGDTVLDRNYPLDIAYNVLVTERKAFAYEKYTDAILKNELIKQNFQIISVKQGYAKCATTSAKKCIITEDVGISDAADKNGFSVLAISPGGVALKGFEYGFIGGATGWIDDTLFFFGDITAHKDYKSIKLFLKKNGISFRYIPDVPLTDVGTLIGI